MASGRMRPSTHRTRWLGRSVALCVCLVMVVLTPTAAWAVTTTRRIDVSDTGAQANNGGSTPRIKRGREVHRLLLQGDEPRGRGHQQHARRLRVRPCDEDGRSRQREARWGSEGFPPYLADFGGEGLRPALSADGRFVAFFCSSSWYRGTPTSRRTSTSMTATPIRTRIFDEAGATDTDRVSVASDGSQATPYSNYYTDISADGRYVTFASDCNNLVAGDTKDVATSSCTTATRTATATSMNPVPMRRAWSASRPTGPRRGTRRAPFRG